MSTVGLGFVIEVVSSRSGVWWADIICICIIDYTSPRPVEKASVHVLLHLEECTTSEVRVCGRKGTSYSLAWADFAGSTGLRGNTANWAKINAYMSYFGARTRSRAREVGFFPHGRDLAGFEPRTFRFQGFAEGKSGCERISPDPLGYGAT